MLSLIKKLKERKKEVKFGKFQCPIGNIEAEIFPIPSYKRKNEFFKYSSEGHHLWGKHHDLSEQEIIAVSILNNFSREHSVSCPKMNLKKKDNGDMYCTVTDAPGTCLAMPQENREYSHKTCPYLIR